MIEFLRSGAGHHFIDLPSPLANVAFGKGSILPFSDDFSAAKPQWTGATWGVAGGVASNTPTLGSELLSNGGFETYTGTQDDGVGDTVNSWTFNVAIGDTTADVRSGSNALRLINSGTDTKFASQSITAAAGLWLLADLYWLDDTGNQGFNNFFNGVIPATLASSSNPASYTQFVRTARVSTANPTFFMRSNGAGNGGRLKIDDVSIKAMTLATLFRTVNAGVSDVSAQVEITRTAGTQGGLVMCLNSTSSPANFVIVYLDGGNNVRVDNSVAGVYTNVSSNAVTYSAGAVLKCVKSGTSFTTTYNGIEEAVDTISDAGIIDNGRHGLFSTYSANQFDDFLLE